MSKKAAEDMLEKESATKKNAVKDETAAVEKGRAATKTATTTKTATRKKSAVKKSLATDENPSTVEKPVVKEKPRVIDESEWITQKEAEWMQNRHKESKYINNGVIFCGITHAKTEERPAVPKPRNPNLDEVAHARFMEDTAYIEKWQQEYFENVTLKQCELDDFEIFIIEQCRQHPGLLECFMKRLDEVLEAKEREKIEYEKKRKAYEDKKKAENRKK